MSGLSSIAPFLAGIPYVGTILTTTVGSLGLILPAIGVFALTAGKVLFDVAKWGVGKLGDIAQDIEEKAKKRMFLNNIKKALDNIEKQIVGQIEKININEFKESYINSKFPQKILLENKIKIIKEKHMDTQKLAEKEFFSLEQLKNDLLLVVPEEV